MKKYTIEIVFGILLVLLLGGIVTINLTKSSEPFSLDMIDDAIHDKYEKNTDEYHRYRIAKDEKLLQANSGSLIPYDNLAVSYDHVGELDKALAIYKTKKEIMDTTGADMQDQYRYHANLGTFLIHHGIKTWFKDKANTAAQNEVIEGKNHIEKAIEINVNAHFGRENYQLVANKWLISAFRQPEVLMTQNLLGKKSLDSSLLTSENTWSSCGQKYHELYPTTKKAGKTQEEQINDSCPMALKGVIGMIRYGGGPSPFSYAAIGDILTAMGEYRLAFAAYARAIRLKHQDSANMVLYSKKLAKKVLPNLSEDAAYAQLASQFDVDYKLGNDWSNAYMDYQKRITKEGKDPTTDESYVDFYSKYGRPSEVRYER